MRIKCTTLIAAVFTALLPLSAQRPGANQPAGNQSNSNQSANNQSANNQSAGTQGTTPEVVNSELFVARADSSIFTMKLDESIFGVPAKSFNLTNLTPGFHHIQLLKPALSSGPRKNAAPEILYDGYVNVPEASRVTALNTGNNQLNIVSIVPLLQYLVGIITGQNGQNGNGGWNQGTGSPWGWPQLPQGMASADFEMLKSTVSSKTFDNDKLSILKMAMLNNHFTASQVTQLVSLFDFESNKVAVAKALYTKVVDKGNYYLVNNAFNFSSSSEELADYITGFGG